MNLDQIATKCFILALFIRDDGERLLLGDGFYDFNQKLQHFQANTIANDVVEIQGDNGQLLAGQVMRSGAQKFEGYIGDATTSRQIIEQKRSDFMAFFRIKHFYKVIYIFPDGTAIQRRRGYLTDAPTIPEIFQKFPEYSIALNFEDVNYYEYAEDEHGDEIYAHIAELALSGNATGGLIWDEIGAVTNGITWSGIQTAQGEYIQVTNDLDIPAKLASVEMLGKAEQTTYSGKNLMPLEPYRFGYYYGESVGTQIDYDVTTSASLVTFTPNADGTSKLAVTASWRGMWFMSQALTAGTYYFDLDGASSTGNMGASVYALDSDHKITRQILKITGNPVTTALKMAITLAEGETYISLGIGVRTTAGTVTMGTFMLSSGSTATAYEPYVGGTPAPNPSFPQPISVVTGENVVKIEGKNIYNNDLPLDNKYLDASGNWVASTYSYINQEFSIQPSTTYTWSASSKTGAPNLRFGEFDASGAFIRRTLITATNQSITTTATTASVKLSADGTPQNKYNDPQLELGSTATAYEPYQGQEFEVNLGKNLFSISQDTIITNAYLNNNTALTFDSLNSVKFVATGAQGAQYLDRIISGLDSTKSYTFSFKAIKNVKGSTGLPYIQIVAYGSNDGSTWTGLGFSRNDNPTEGETYSFAKTLTGYSQYRFMIFNNADTPVEIGETTTYFDMQLEEGAQTAYAPYFTPIELAKIGNYQDRIYKTDSKWYIEKQVGKVVLDGTEQINLAGSTANYYEFNVKALTIPSPSSYLYPLSDHFASVANNRTVSNGQYLLIRVPTPTTSTDVASFKTWLASHPTTVYYALATPTTTEITNEALIAQLDALGASSLYLGANYIGTETLNAMPTLKIDYYTEYTLDGAGYEWEPGGNTSRTIVTVAGVDSAWPIWTIQGGAQDPTLTNITTGQTISWQGFVPEGQTLTINMAEMTADLAGANVFEYITGEWLRLAPGNNTLVYNAGSADKPSTLSWNGVLA